ncbi:MAG: SEC-C domain-containing protein [Campylobacterota bacterium]|nr:SEC-C domain-containing protein [Campylobacterota bacterium]
MLEDISIYQDTKRNEKCPCQSGKIFKKCCMKEYREARKKNGGSNRPSAKISCFSPLPQIPEKERKEFTDFYIELMIFSNQCEHNTDIVAIESENEDMQGFVSKQREYFYKNSDEIIDRFISEKNPSKEKLEILESIRVARFGEYFLLSRGEDTAIIMDKKENIYNVKALNSPFNEIFGDQEKYLGLKTSLIPYKNCYITDGIYRGFATTKEMDKYFDNLAYTELQIIYSKDNEITIMPVVINFAIGASMTHFEKMEDILLKKIPIKFTKSFVKFLENEYVHNVALFSSFFRSTDLNAELNTDEGEQLYSTLIGGSSTVNYEKGGDKNVISHEIINEYYQQKPLKESISKSVYKNVQKNKNTLFSAFKTQVSFYTMLGTMHVDVDNYDNLIDVMKDFEKTKPKKEIMDGLDKLFEELDQEYGVEIDGIFLGMGNGLNSIYHHIDEYRDYHKDQDMTLEEMRQYAISERIY